MHNAAKNALELRKVGAKTRASLFVGPRSARAGAVARRNLRRVTFFRCAKIKVTRQQRWRGLRAKNSGGARARAVIFRAQHAKVAASLCVEIMRTTLDRMLS